MSFQRNSYATFEADYDMNVRIARYHLMFMKFLWDMAIWSRNCTAAFYVVKSLKQKLSGNHEIEVWGDGEQTVHLCTLMIASQVWIKCGKVIIQTINLGSSEMVSINQLIDMIEKIAEIKVERKYDLILPQGVRGSQPFNFTTKFIKEHTGWEPSVGLQEGLDFKNICLDISKINEQK